MRVFVLLYLLVISVCWANEKTIQEANYSQVCGDLLKYIYKDSALNNLESSLERLNIKIAINYAKTLNRIDKEKINLRKNDELRNLLLNTAKLDPKLDFYLNQTKSYSRFKRWSFFYTDENVDYNFSDLTLAWQKSQKESDQLYSITQSDLKTLELLSQINQVNISDKNLKVKLTTLSANLSENIKQISNGQDLDKQISDLDERLNILDKKMNLSTQSIYQKNLAEYSKYCDDTMMNKLILTENYICPFYSDKSTVQNFDSLLGDIYLVLDKVGINNISLPEKPIIPEPVISEPPKSVIIPHEYENINYKGNYCRRSTAMVDTIVLHHTNTDYEETPDDINNSQIVQHEDDTSPGGFPDPWYMVAYNYLVTSKGYETTDESQVSVVQGRPDIIRGAHAGGDLYVKNVSPNAKKELEKFDFQCGYNSNGSKDHQFSKRSTGLENYYKKQIKDGIVNANFTTVGVALIGNYAPYNLGRGQRNSGGYIDKVRYPSPSVIKKTAKLICELKKGEYKNLTKITDHNYIKIKKDLSDGKAISGTCCPGTLYKRMNDVLTAVKNECPDVAADIKLDISPGTKVCSFLKKL